MERWNTGILDKIQSGSGLRHLILRLGSGWGLEPIIPSFQSLDSLLQLGEDGIHFFFNFLIHVKGRFALFVRLENFRVETHIP